MKVSSFNRAIHQSTRSTFLKCRGSVRYEYFVKYLIVQDSWVNENAYATALLVFDGVTYDKIVHAIKQTPYATDDGVCISWRSKDGRFHRYILSSMTINIYSLVKSKDCFDSKNFEELYSKFAGYKNTIQIFKEDQMQWMALHFSGPLFEHLSDRLLFSGLPDSAYARLSSKQRLVVESPASEISDRAICEGISGYLEPTGLDRNPVIIDQLMYACRRRVKVSDHLAKKKMLEECLLLSSPAKEYGPFSSLMVAWAISLIVHGSRQQEDLSQAAIANYVTVISLKLFSQFRDKEIQTLNPEAFTDLYKKTIDLVTIGQQKIAASAISTFHHFLENWLDIPFIPRQQYLSETDSIPRANVIWPHEIEIMLQWLCDAQCDERLINCWRLSILLGYEKRVRIGELFEICIEDIQFFENKVQIHIKGQKTKASKRNIVISSARTIEYLKEYVTRRKKELALVKDYLFGDPKQPRSIYKMGQFYYGLNAMLKAVTGDCQASSHWLSHSEVSFGLQNNLQGGGVDFINPFSQFSTDVGHYSFATTCYEYMHLHHIPIRNSLNRALSKVEITSEVVSKWTGKVAAAIRKRVSDHSLDRQSYYWKCILSSKHSTYKFDTPDVAISTEHAIAPDFFSLEKGIGFQTIFHVLRDLSKGVLVESVIFRQGLVQDDLNFIVEKTIEAIYKYQLIEGWTYQTSFWEAINKLSDMKTHGYDFDKAMHSKFKPIFSYLSKQQNVSQQDLRNGLLGWCRLYRESYGTYQKLDAEVNTLYFLRNLFQSGMDVTKLSVFSEQELSVTANACRESIRQAFISSFGVTPPFFLVEPRRGRPKHYLVVTHNRVDSKNTPYCSATSMSGFHAVNFAALVWMECCYAND